MKCPPAPYLHFSLHLLILFSVCKAGTNIATHVECCYEDDEANPKCLTTPCFENENCISCKGEDCDLNGKSQHITAQAVNTKNVQCSVKNGLTCYKAGGEDCKDWKVRWYCAMATSQALAPAPAPGRKGKGGKGLGRQSHKATWNYTSGFHEMWRFVERSSHLSLWRWHSLYVSITLIVGTDFACPLQSRCTAPELKVAATPNA